jgi:ubiquinone/menaquinone biosynthesis C-methylase UbiE
MLALPYPDNSFDAVVCIRQLNHLLCWPELLKEIGRVARRVVIVEYPALCSFNCIQSMMFPIKHALEGNTRKFLVFSSSEISAAASAAKLKSQKRTPQFFLPVGVIRQMRLPALVALLEGLARALGMVKLFGSPVIHKLSKVQD